MRQIQILSALLAAMLAPAAFAQAQSSGTGTGTASSNASNQGANSSTNTSNAFQNSASNATSSNSQNNGSASSLTATINIQQPAAASGASASTNSANGTALRQSLDSTSTSRNEQVLSGSQTQNFEYSGSYTIKNVPNVSASPLISSNDTCMGSASGGVAGAGFGVTLGATYTDEHCKRIKMSRELWNKGMKAASLAMDCMDRDAREALELTGYVCPQTVRAQHAAAETAQLRADATLARAGTPRTFPPALPLELQPQSVVQSAAETPLLARDATVAPPDSQVAGSSTDPTPQGNVVIRRVDAKGDAAAAQARGE